MTNEHIMTTLKRVLMPALLTASLAAGAVAAQNRLPLNEEPHINDSLISAAIGELIRRNCSSISPRYLVVFSKIRALESYARDKGYTEEEVEAFLDDKDEQKRVRRAAMSYLREQGVVKGDEASYCAAGRAEIDKGTLTGEMLWSSGRDG